MYLQRSHIVFWFVFYSSASWIEGHNHSKVAVVFETCIDSSQFLEPFDDVVLGLLYFGVSVLMNER